MTSVTRVGGYERPALPEPPERRVLPWDTGIRELAKALAPGAQPLSPSRFQVWCAPLSRSGPCAEPWGP